MSKIRMFSIMVSATIIVGGATHSLIAEPDAASRVQRNSSTPSTLDAGRFVVHEWGTFTTFSGSDGVFMDFRPLAVEHNDLPNYVLDRGSYSIGNLLSKSRIWGRVRMETPVTYFYTDRVRTVDVRVDFPQGLLTEFYPPVQQFLPPIDQQTIFGTGESIGNSSLYWGQLELIPTEQLVPNTTNAETHAQITEQIVKRLLPHAANEQHYAAARETDSALVFRSPVSLDATSGAWNAIPSEAAFEKFLFYRGVGKFQLPVAAKYQPLGIVFENSGDLPISTAILIDVDGPAVKTATLHGIEAGQSLPFDPLASVTEQELADRVQSALIQEGLYEKEAAAMVKTWQQSWFTENGTRILYMVPGSITDELLPLHINPPAQETLRVLVGRLEIMTPEMELKMTNAVARSGASRIQHISQQTEQSEALPYTVPSEIRDFGRMTEPALLRVAKIAKDTTVRQEAALLALQLRQ